MGIILTETAKIPTHVMTRILGEEAVVLDLSTGTYFGLDPVGARIWGLLSEGYTFDRVCEQLSREYQVSREELEHDTLELVSELERQNLIEVFT